MSMLQLEFNFQYLLILGSADTTSKYDFSIVTLYWSIGYCRLPLRGCRQQSFDLLFFLVVGTAILQPEEVVQRDNPLAPQVPPQRAP